MTESPAFLDTNILLRYFLRDYPDQWPRCVSLMEEIARGERSVLVSETVVFETVFVLEKRRQVPRPEIASALLSFIELSSVVLSGKHVVRDAFALYVEHPGLSFADCYHVIFALKHGITQIFTFDKRIGRIPGVQRIEP